MTVTQIHPAPENAFAEFWKSYPHNPRRKSKAAAKTLFDKITGGGISTRTRNKDSGGYLDLFLSATPEEILEGVKTYRKDMTDRTTYKVDTTYVPDAVVWLNGGRWDND